MNYILIMFAGLHHGGVSIWTQEFSTKQTCEAAKELILQNKL